MMMIRIKVMLTAAITEMGDSDTNNSSQNGMKSDENNDADDSDNRFDVPAKVLCVLQWKTH